MPSNTTHDADLIEGLDLADLPGSPSEPTEAAGANGDSSQDSQAPNSGAGSGEEAAGGRSAFEAALDNDLHPANETSQTTVEPATNAKGSKPEPKDVTEVKGAQPPKPENDDVEPTDEDKSRGFVPVKKLLRSLDVRRKALDRANQLEGELKNERAFNHQVLNVFSQAGVPDEQMDAFLGALATARQSPDRAKELLRYLGAEVPTAKPLHTDADFQEALNAAVDAMDPEAGLKVLRAKQAASTKPAANGQPQPAHPMQASQQRQQPPRQTGPSPELRAEITGMAQTLKVAFGEKNAAQIGVRIDQVAGRELERLKSLRAEVTDQVIRQVYQETRDKVITAIRNQTKKAPTFIKSAPTQTATPTGKSPRQQYEETLT